MGNLDVIVYLKKKTQKNEDIQLECMLSGDVANHH